MPTVDARPEFGQVSDLARRQVHRGAIVVALFCGGMSALVASQYQPIGDLLNESNLRALAENPATRILSGPPVALDDPGGFTVWRTGTAAAVLASIWILLAATRITRGEEDTGRWNLLLAGRLRLVDVAASCLVVLVGSAALIGVAVAAGLLAAGTEVTGALIYAAGIAGTALTFAMAGTLAAQVMPGRSGATGLAAAALGVALTLRMVADGSHQLAWLAWTTPFGLTARASPYADNSILPLIVLSAFPVTLAGAAFVAASHRDLGAGVVTVPSHRPLRGHFLRSVEGFALRRTAWITSGWALGIAAYFLLVGAMLASLLELFDTNPRFAEIAASAGTGRDDLVGAVTAALFGVLAVPSGLYATLRLASMVSDEKAGRTALLLAQPVSRVRLIFAEFVVTAGGVISLHCSAAVAIWVGAKTTGAPLQLDDAIVDALTFLPIALLAAGAAALAVGWFPASVGAIGSLPLVGGYLVNVIAQTTQAPRWIVNLSPWTHVTAGSGAAADWAATAVLLLAGMCLTALGVLGFVRRDSVV
ncbi:hypothetical protein [Mycolicibacterium celeriflavum]|uniref:hypothetical protein n=1 Tax=Mycolicibacterium celeriflavum TaxID=1249101 RepID=UPI003CF70288